jgi:hypothetical protein
MTESEALALVRQLLADTLDAQPKGQNAFVRDLAGRIGELQQTMRSAITIIDRAGGQS